MRHVLLLLQEQLLRKALLHVVLLIVRLHLSLLLLSELELHDLLWGATELHRGLLQLHLDLLLQLVLKVLDVLDLLYGAEVMGLEQGQGPTLVGDHWYRVGLRLVRARMVLRVHVLLMLLGKDVALGKGLVQGRAMGMRGVGVLERGWELVVSVGWESPGHFDGVVQRRTCGGHRWWDERLG